jgi:hypothetical protein
LSAFHAPPSTSAGLHPDNSGTQSGNAKAPRGPRRPPANARVAEGRREGETESFSPRLLLLRPCLPAAAVTPTARRWRRREGDSDRSPPDSRARVASQLFDPPSPRPLAHCPSLPNS